MALFLHHTLGRVVSVEGCISQLCPLFAGNDIGYTCALLTTPNSTASLSHNQLLYKKVNRLNGNR